MQPASRRGARLLRTHPYPPPVADLERYRDLWRRDPQRRADPICSGRPCRYREDRASWSPAAARRRPPSTPCAGRRRGSPASTSARRASPAPSALKRKYGLEQPRGSPAAGRARGRARSELRPDRLHRRAASPGRSRSRASRRCATCSRREGAMQLMVYAPYGRTGVYMLQEYCRRLGMRAVDNDIRELIGALSLLPPGHPLEACCARRPTSATRRRSPMRCCIRRTAPIRCRSYSNSSKVGAWRSAAGSDRRPTSRTAARWPDPPGGAAAATARGRAVRRAGAVPRHDGPAQRVVYRADSAGPSQRDRLFRRRLARLRADPPARHDRGPGAAAAGRRRRADQPRHTYTDIYLPIDAEEKRLVDAIDGKLTIGEIARAPGRLDLARGLFERLWRYDQVVFDASRKGSES